MEQFPREVTRAGSKYRHEILYNQEKKKSILTKWSIGGIGKGYNRREKSCLSQLFQLEPHLRLEGG